MCSRKLHSEPIFALAVSTRITKQNQNQKQHVGQIRGICNTERESERQVLVTTGGGDASLQRTVLNNSIQHQPDAKGMVGNMVLDSMDSVNLPHPGNNYAVRPITFKLMRVYYVIYSASPIYRHKLCSLPL